MATQPLAQVSHQARQHTLLIAISRQDQRTFLAAQPDADGHTVYEADTTAAVIARLSARAIDALVLGELARPADGPAFLRAVRAGEHPRIHPGLAVITIGATDELTVLRAYESGSHHHLPHDTGYLLLRAVLQSVVRRSLEDVTARYLQAGDIGVDLAARSADVAGNSAAWSSSCSSSSPATPSGSSAETSSHAASGASSRSAHAPLTATSPGCAPASPPRAPTTCSSTSGDKDGRSSPRGSSHAIHGRAGHASYQLDEATAAFNPLQTNPSWSWRELRRQERESRESRRP
jgi:hypothetical protein